MSFCSANVFAQFQDNIWLMGYYPVQFGSKYVLGCNKFDFNFEPPKVSKLFLNRYHLMESSTTTVSDESGELLFYANGFQVFDKNDNVMKGDNFLNPGIVRDDYWNKGKPSFGFPMILGMMTIPIGKDPEKYMIIHQNISEDFVFPNKTYFSKVSFENNDLGEVLVSNVLIDSSQRQKFNSVVKHGDGINWWLIISNDGILNYKKYMFRNGQVDIENEQSIGELPTIESSAQALFSPDGSKFFKHNNSDFSEIFDFNRCTGQLSNPRKIPLGTYSPGAGAAFSHDSRYLYLTSYQYVFQFDTEATDVFATMDTVGTCDFKICGSLPYSYVLCQLGPDGRIYISSGNTTDCMSMIEYPFKQGKACQVQNNAISLAYLNDNTIPNNPNYRLGPMDGSPCDTLGMDNIPIARFRKSSGTDTIIFTDLSYGEPDEWFWEFGDGSTSSGRFPEHIYTASGIYNVCLTVTNKKGSNSTCQDVKTAVYEQMEDKSNTLSIYPNPATDQISLASNTLSWKAFPAIMNIYDMLGRLVLSKPIQYVTDVVDISELTTGVYMWKLDKNSRRYGQGKMVVER